MRIPFFIGLLCFLFSCGQPPDRNLKNDTLFPEDSLLAQEDFRNEHESFLEKFNVRFRKITVNDGLSQSSIGFMLQDSRGYIWIATSDGLNRYDGYEFKVFRNIPSDTTSISANEIGMIKEDLQGNIWATTTAGLCCYSPRTGKFTNYVSDSTNPEAIRTTPNNYGLELQDTSFIWIHCDEGLDLFDRKTRRFRHFEVDANNPGKLPHKYISSIVITNDTAWVSTHGGVCYIECSNNYKLTRIDSRKVDRPQWLFNLGGEHFYLSSANGLFNLNRHTRSLSEVLTETNQSLYDSLFSNGIFVMERITTDLFLIGGWYVAKPTYIRNNVATPLAYEPHSYQSLGSASVMQDFSSSFLVGGEGVELSVGNPYNSIFHNFRTDDPVRAGITSSVWSFAEDAQRNIWIATQNYIFKMDRTTAKMTHVNLYPGDSLANTKNGAFTIFNDDSGNVYVCNNRMLHRFDGKTGENTRLVHDDKDSTSSPRYNISAACRSKDGTHWLAMFNRGICKFDPLTKKFTYINGGRMSSDGSGIATIRWLLEDEQGRLWAGTDEGLDLLNPLTNQFEQKLRNSPLSTTIFCFVQQDENHLWLGTTDKGLLQYNIPDDKVVETYDTERGLPNNYIYGITREENGILWMSTNLGLCRFDPVTRETQNYTHADGLQSNEFGGGAVFKDRDGRLYFGGTEGFNIIDPKLIRKNPFPPRTIISGMKLFNKPILPNDSLFPNSATTTTSVIKQLGDQYYIAADISCLDEIELNYDQNYLSFDFTSIHLANPAKNKYEYRMEGLEMNWNEAGTRRYATYTNIPYGDYVLHVRSSNCDGVKDERGISLHIIIHPPFWHTWWFRILSGLVIVSGLYGLYRWRTASLRKRKYELEITVRERTAEVVRQSKEIEKQKDLIQEKNRDITDSINYAKRIQQAILPSEKLFWVLFPSSFVLYKPKDIVAGDFYWLERKDNTIFLAVADCTGHGVPGAMVSVVCHNALNRSVHEFGLRSPADILNKTREIVIAEFSKSDEQVRDGMDISLCVFRDGLKGKLEWAGANSPLWMVRDGVLTEFKPDKQPIGKYAEEKSFTQHNIELKKGDQLYMTSDGFADQFGGDKGKKYKTSQFKQLIEQVASLPMKDQMKEIDRSNTEWRGNMEQVDDICVIGVKI